MREAGGNKSVRSLRSSPIVFSTISPAKCSEAYDTFWNFAVERQRIFFQRLGGAHAPWTHDRILGKYKFTNAYRASDRVSQYLIRNVIYDRTHEPIDLYFRIVLFKLFNKIETWRLMERELGDICAESFRFKDYDAVLSAALSRGESIYSAAYIMASGCREFEVTRKHQAHLRLVERMLAESMPARIAECRSMRAAFELLKSYPLFGDFLAYQLITDLNYSSLTDFTEMEFTMPGPGARDGIRKCFASLGGLSESDAIRLVADRQEREFERLGLDFRSLWGRPLQLIDIQNLFCEVDKYSRESHPDLQGISGRTKIKQRFMPKPPAPAPFYPPKWGINQFVIAAGVEG